jgi:ribulose-phosphate 3-epimerase
MEHMDMQLKSEKLTVQNRIQIAPSLICADLCNLEREVKALEACGVDYLHVDLLDAHFSPSMPIGIEVVRRLRERTNLPFDVHLMVDNNEFFIEEMIGIGVQQICFHQESAFHVDRLLDLIKEKQVKAGIAISPATPLSVLDFVAEKLDFVMLMLINPGFAGHSGQTQVPYGLRKIAECRKLLTDRHLDIPIEVDGRVSK